MKRSVSVWWPLTFSVLAVLYIATASEAACRVKKVEQLLSTYTVTLEDSVSASELETFSRTYDGRGSQADFDAEVKAVIAERCVFIDRIKAAEVPLKKDVTVKFK